MIASGFGEQADKDVFIIGPTGLRLGADGTLYVSDAIGNRIAAIPDAATRTDSAGTGRDVTKDGLLKRPLAMTTAPNGHLLVTNGLNGQVVEIDPATGKQLYAHWIDANKAQQPPGNGDLFGIAHDARRRWFLLRGGRGRTRSSSPTDEGADVTQPMPIRVPPRLPRRRPPAWSRPPIGHGPRRSRPPRASRQPARPQGRNVTRAVLGRASGRHRHPAAEPHLFRRFRPGRPASAATWSSCCKHWTEAAARMTAGADRSAAAASDRHASAAADSGEALGLAPARLTVTFGFGPGLFSKDGTDRYGLAGTAPGALVDLPRFNGDQLEPARTGGDLSVQACADDPQVAFHAVRQLARLAYGVGRHPLDADRLHCRTPRPTTRRAT